MTLSKLTNVKTVLLFKMYKQQEKEFCASVLKCDKLAYKNLK